MATPGIPIPGPSGIIQSFNTAKALITEPCGALDKLAAAHGLTSQVTLGPVRLVIIGDAEHVAELLATDSAAFRWGRVARTLTIVIGKTSMIVSDGDDHKRRRSLAQPAFAKRRLDSWAVRIVEETDRLIDETMGSNIEREVNLHDLHRKLIRRISVRVLFGDDLRTRADEIGECIEPAMQYAGQPALRQAPHPFPFTFRAQAKKARKNVDRLLDSIITDRRALTSDPDSDSLVDALIHAEHNGQHLDDAEIRDQIVTLIGAGYDTTSAVLSWTVARAALHDSAWLALRNEATEHLDAAATTANLKLVPYASATIDEALRLHPAGPFSPREVVRDVTIGEYTIRKGSVIAYSPHLMGRDPRIWPNALEFQPERFLSTNPDVEAQRRAAWIPFGRGSRSCIGFALAQMQLTLVTARIAQRLDVTITQARLPNPSGLVVTRPDGGLPATIRRFDTHEATRVN